MIKNYNIEKKFTRNTKTNGLIIEQQSHINSALPTPVSGQKHYGLGRHEVQKKKNKDY